MDLPQIPDNVMEWCSEVDGRVAVLDQIGEMTGDDVVQTGRYVLIIEDDNGLIERPMIDTSTLGVTEAQMPQMLRLVGGLAIERIKARADAV